MFYCGKVSTNRPFNRLTEQRNPTENDRLSEQRVPFLSKKFSMMPSDRIKNYDERDRSLYGQDISFYCDTVHNCFLHSVKKKLCPKRKDAHKKNVYSSNEISHYFSKFNIPLIRLKGLMVLQEIFNTGK